MNNKKQRKERGNKNIITDKTNDHIFYTNSKMISFLYPLSHAITNMMIGTGGDRLYAFIYRHGRFGKI